jgi:hypothetical protein
VIHVRTSTLCTIASELDDALDALDPKHPAFGPVMTARALYRVHVMLCLPPVHIHPTTYEPAIGNDESVSTEVDAAGTFLG